MRGLVADIMRNPHGDFSLGGISSRCTEVTVVGLRGGEVFDVTPERPAVKIVTRHLFGRDYMHVEPVESGCWAHGGTVIDCSDSRFREVAQYPLRFHDRDMSKEKR